MSAAPAISPQGEFLSTYTRMQPELVRDRYHRYQLGSLGPLPGITTVTGKKSKGDALQYWAAGCSATYVVSQIDQLKADPASAPQVIENLSDWKSIRGKFNEDRGQKADVGSQFHLVAERFAQGRPLDPSILLDEVKPRAFMLDGFLRKLQPRVIATEFPVFSETFGYAGTLDFLGVLDLGDGRGECLWILDYKTGESAFEAREGGKTFYPDEYWMQLMAAVKADFIYDTERCIRIPMPKVARIGSVNVRPDKAVLWEWPIDEPAAFHSFIGLLAVYQMEKLKTVPARRVDLNGGLR